MAKYGCLIGKKLQSTVSGEGLALVDIEDAGSYYTGTTVEAALQEVGANFGDVTNMQVATGTFVAGTATIAAGIVVTANSYGFVVNTAAVTGSTNVGCPMHLKASDTVGAAGVGDMTFQMLGADGAIDTDAAGAFVALIIN